jgi:hypothetical protein
VATAIGSNHCIESTWCGWKDGFPDRVFAQMEDVPFEQLYLAMLY